MKGKPCPRCLGKGYIEDDRVIGESFRLRREKNGISLRAVAGRWGFSASYVSDLELGRRRWNGRQREGYVRSLDELIDEES